MSASHPEQTGDVGLEPGVNELLALRRITDELERAGIDELRQAAIAMARLVVVVHPAALRYLANEAARNLSQSWVPSDHPRAEGDSGAASVTSADATCAYCGGKR